MKGYPSSIDPRLIYLFMAIIATTFLVSGVLAGISTLMAFVVVIALIVCLICFIKPEAALYILVFAMLLSPEFGERTAAGAGGSGVTIRVDDFLLVLIGFAWIARTALDKNLGLFLKTTLNRPIFTYFMACVVATSLGVVIGNVKPIRGFFYLLKYFEYYVVYFMLVNHLRRPQQIRYLLIAMFLTCFIIDLVGIAQIPGGKRVSAPFEGEHGEPNTLGGYLVLITSVSFSMALHLESLKAKILLWGLSGLNIVTLMFTRSRGSYLAFIVMYLSLMFLTRKKTLVVILLAAVVSGPYILPDVVVERISYTFHQKAHRGQKKIGNVTIDTSTSDRLQGWVDGFNAFLKRPLFGYGVTGFGFLDSQYMVVMVETGLVGIFSFLALLWALFKESWISYRQAGDEFYRALCLGFIVGVLAMIIHSASANTFIIVRVMEPFWFLAGLVIMTRTFGNPAQTGGGDVIEGNTTNTLNKNGPL